MDPTSLAAYRDARAAARAYHPSVWPIWTPSDVIDTANDFHAGADAERGVELAEAPWFVSQSRARKAKWLNRAAVALLLATSVFLGAILYAASAKADGVTDAYEVEYGPAACSYLSDHPTIAGLSAVIIDATAIGLTPEQAGQAVASSVLDICPQYTPLLRQFVARYAPRTTT